MLALLEAALLAAALLPTLLEALLPTLLEATLLLAALLPLLAAPPAPPAPPAPVVVAAAPPTPLELDAVVDVTVLLLVAVSPAPVVLPPAELLEPLVGESGEEHPGASSSGVEAIARMAVSWSFVFKEIPSKAEGATPTPFSPFILVFTGRSGTFTK